MKYEKTVPNLNSSLELKQEQQKRVFKDKRNVSIEAREKLGSNRTKEFRNDKCDRVRWMIIEKLAAVRHLNK